MNTTLTHAQPCSLKCIWTCFKRVFLHMCVVQTFTYMEYICRWVKILIQMAFC